MNTTETTVTCRQIRSASEETLDRLCHDIRSFMGAYSDPRRETLEALRIAFENGMVLEGILDGRRVGIAVLTRTRFDHFQPHYHLAYIAVDASCRGMGLGKQMLTEVERVTRGNVALHVGTTNENAIAFYRKRGWRTQYLRMMPEGLSRHMAE